MKRYKSTKRNKTKQRRKTHKTRINKRRKTQKRRINNRRKYDMKGGMLKKPTIQPEPGPKPMPPSAPEIDPERGELISSFEEIRYRKLYLFSGSDDTLYMYMDVPRVEKPYYKSDVQSFIEDHRCNACELKMNECIIQYCKKDKYSSYYNDIILYRANFDKNNYLCCEESYKWIETNIYLFEGAFDYINSIYNIYEIDEWPAELAYPTVRNGSHTILPVIKERLESEAL
uniref:Uncharacterized protein n=1 Tax=viral metagenome TaxID=1070528 RepID=A0A6C0F4T0_9ZZZZ